MLREIPAGIPQSEVSAGQQFSLGSMSMQVLWPARYIRAGSMPNNASVVVLASLEGRGILLTGDIEREAQSEIMREVTSVDVDVLKVPHHGSANLDPGFSEWAEPEIALISVGEDNDYGHPARAAIDQWRGARIYRTDQDGAVALSLSPDGAWSAVTRD